MRRSTTVVTRIAGILLAAAAARVSAATITTLEVDFENPPFTLGAIGGNPPYTSGQGGWGGFGANAISDAQAHSGSQSLSTANGGSIAKALDPSLGEYPVAGVFEIGYLTDWWVQAWVHLTADGSGAQMTLSNGLGGCPLIQIQANGTPYFNTCTRQDISQPALGSDLFDQWILLRMVHTASMGQALNMSIIGDHVDLTSTLDQYTGPGTANPGYIVLGGDAYWDDVAAGHGEAPSMVPAPASGILLGTGFLSLLRRRRMRR